MSEVQYLGIRHHGPGSSRQVLAALDRQKPDLVLIEGPADLSDLLSVVGHPSLLPPVALLAYVSGEADRVSFWPFAEFSPEFQTIRWALENGAQVAFIDLPASTTLAMEEASEPEAITPVSRDPIGALASAAGYEDGESWWGNVIEENPDPGEVFAAIADAMTALREDHIPDQREAMREAHMRRAIRKASRDDVQKIAVVCGAWHVPALTAKHKASTDNALLKGMPKTKISATWAPWTSARLARQTGYGAGVDAPVWYQHLWQNGSGSNADALWIAKMAAVLREEGFDASTASLIETVRLTTSLAAIRDRPAPGFSEMRDAAISTLMMGETLPWRIIEKKMLLGSDVGTIPGDLPLAPLLEDLQKQQKKLRMKPEALERDLSIDLRSESGLARSTLLHRLLALDVPWGKMAGAGRSRGTFRENWQLRWDPEFAVRLVEHLAYGPTIEHAAGGRLAEAINSETNLGTLAEKTRDALVAQLPEVANTGIARLDVIAAETDDCAVMLSVLGPVVDTLRYGTARDMALDRLDALLDRLIVQSALAMPYAARGLDTDESANFYALLAEADKAIALSERGGEILSVWQDALHDVGMSDLTSPMIAGLATRLAYEADRLSAEEVSDLMSLRLSRALPAIDAAGFFEGFFNNAGLKLVHDSDLRKTVDAWMMSLDDEAFSENLPLFRRVFSTLDQTERKLLLEHLLGIAGTGKLSARFAPDSDAIWQSQMKTLRTIFDGDG